MGVIFAPHVQYFLDEVLSDGKLGIFAGSVGLVHPKTGGPSGDHRSVCDRFKLVIPYGGQTVTWEVIFPGNRYDLPPDFIFDDKNFLPKIERIPSLCNWKHDDPTALHKVIQELLQAYRRDVSTHLEEFPRLQFEYTSLIQHTDLTADNIEVLMNQKNKNGAVNFFIRLPIDFSKIPPILTLGNPGDDAAILLITFHSPECNRVTPQLHLSPRVEHVLDAASLRIPNFVSGGCLIDYVPVVQQTIANKVDEIVTGFEKRKEYVASFLSFFGRSILEYDAERFFSLSFLFEWDDFYFIFHISVPNNFPQEKPVFTFQSVYHADSGQPFFAVCSDYPYSPRWPGKEMAERAKAFILDYVAEFQKKSIQ